MLKLSRISLKEFIPGINVQIKYITYNSSKSPKKLTNDGPGLKEFILREKIDKSNENDETLANKIFLSNLKRLNGQENRVNTLNDFEKRKVFFEIHGCQMNTNDTEVAYSILDKTGLYERTLDSNKADVILLMTCSIRENAEQKIWNRLKDFTYYKNKQFALAKKNVQIGILGCMAERLKEKIIVKERLVDVVVGPDSYRLLPSLLEQSYSTGNSAMNTQLSFDETYAEISPLRINENSKNAFVSIQRGCDNMCSFCIVPFVRGKERSRPIGSIIDEVKKLSDAGIKEVTLLGQNVNSYRDMSDKTFKKENETEIQIISKGFKSNYKPRIGGRQFVDLLDLVSQIDPEMRIRFTSPHPKNFPDDLLALMKERPNIARTIHLPAQSGSSTCLERMRRGYTREAYLDLVAKIRDIIPNIAFTTDLIAGFCGETDEEHNDTISLMKLVNYTYCFMYTYSMREKTRAFHRLEDNVPNEVKSKRYKEILDTFRTLATQLNASKINQTHLVLIDKISKRSDDDYSGRNDHNTLVAFPKYPLPHFDNVVDYTNYLNSKTLQVYMKKSLPQVGDYVACKIVSATSQSFRAIPLFSCKLQTFHQIEIDMKEKKKSLANELFFVKEF